MQGRFQDLKKECGSGPLTNICLAKLFRGLFKEFGTKTRLELQKFLIFLQRIHQLG